MHVLADAATSVLAIAAVRHGPPRGRAAISQDLTGCNPPRREHGLRGGWWKRAPDRTSPGVSPFEALAVTSSVPLAVRDWRGLKLAGGFDGAYLHRIGPAT